MPDISTLPPETDFEPSGLASNPISTAELPRVMTEAERQAAIETVVAELHPKIEQRLRELGLEGRKLNDQELVDLVIYLGEKERQLWSQLVELAPEKSAERHCVEFFHSEHLTIWWLNWDRTEKTALHDHGISRVGLYVADGSIVENYYDPATGKLIVRAFEAGQAASLPSPYIHCVSNPGVRSAQSSVSIHAYSPPLDKMGYYTLDAKNGIQLTSEWVDEQAGPTPSCLVLPTEVAQQRK